MSEQLPPEDAEVIVLPTRASGTDPEHLRLIVSNKRQCRHKAVHHVDVDKRKVTCGACGVELTAWESLLLCAEENENLGRARDHMRRETAALESRVEVLKKVSSALLQRGRKRVEEATGEKVDGYMLRNFVEEAIRDAAREHAGLPSRAAP